MRLLDRLVEAAAVLAFAASSLLILVNVVNRYVVLDFMRGIARDYPSFDPIYRFFRDGLGSWSVMADEVPGYLLVWIAFLGAYLMLRRGGHISFETLVDALPRLAGKAVRIFNSLLLIGFFAILLVQSVRMIRVSGRTEIETAEIAQGWFMAILPLAAILFILAVSIRLADFVRPPRGS